MSAVFKRPWLLRHCQAVVCDRVPDDYREIEAAYVQIRRIDPANKSRFLVSDTHSCTWADLSPQCMDALHLIRRNLNELVGGVLHLVAFKVRLSIPDLDSAEAGTWLDLIQRKGYEGNHLDVVLEVTTVDFVGGDEMEVHGEPLYVGKDEQIQAAVMTNPLGWLMDRMRERQQPRMVEKGSVTTSTPTKWKPSWDLDSFCELAQQQSARKDPFIHPSEPGSQWHEQNQNEANSGEGLANNLTGSSSQGEDEEYVLKADIQLSPISKTNAGSERIPDSTKKVTFKESIAVKSLLKGPTLRDVSVAELNSTPKGKKFLKRNKVTPSRTPGSSRSSQSDAHQGTSADIAAITNAPVVQSPSFRPVEPNSELPTDKVKPVTSVQQDEVSAQRSTIPAKSVSQLHDTKANENSATPQRLAPLSKQSHGASPASAGSLPKAHRSALATSPTKAEINQALPGYEENGGSPNKTKSSTGSTSLSQSFLEKPQSTASEVESKSPNISRQSVSNDATVFHSSPKTHQDGASSKREQVTPAKLRDGDANHDHDFHGDDDTFMDSAKAVVSPNELFRIESTETETSSDEDDDDDSITSAEDKTNTVPAKRLRFMRRDEDRSGEESSSKMRSMAIVGSKPLTRGQRRVLERNKLGPSTQANDSDDRSSEIDDPIPSGPTTTTRSANVVDILKQPMSQESLAQSQVLQREEQSLVQGSPSKSQSHQHKDSNGRSPLQSQMPGGHLTDLVRGSPINLMGKQTHEVPTQSSREMTHSEATTKVIDEAVRNLANRNVKNKRQNLGPLTQAPDSQLADDGDDGDDDGASGIQNTFAGHFATGSQSMSAGNWASSTQRSDSPLVSSMEIDSVGVLGYAPTVRVNHAERLFNCELSSKPQISINHKGVVTWVAEAGPGACAGIQTDDRLVSVNGKTNIAEMKKSLEENLPRFQMEWLSTSGDDSRREQGANASTHIAQVSSNVQVAMPAPPKPIALQTEVQTGRSSVVLTPAPPREIAQPNAPKSDDQVDELVNKRYEHHFGGVVYSGFVVMPVSTQGAINYVIQDVDGSRSVVSKEQAQGLINGLFKGPHEHVKNPTTGKFECIVPQQTPATIERPQTFKLVIPEDRPKKRVKFARPALSVFGEGIDLDVADFSWPEFKRKLALKSASGTRKSYSPTH